jgi:thymidylate kinase
MAGSNKQSSNNGYFIVLEGTDGSGKSTLSQSIADSQYDLDRIEFCSNKKIPKDPTFVEKSMTNIASLLWPKENTSFDHLLPPQYWLYLQATWYSLLYEFVISPKLKEGRTLIIDGWYYKFMAKLLARGFDYDYLNMIFSHIKPPDAVILLELDIEAVWERKKDFRLHEMGLHHSYPELGKSSFIDYQSKIFDCFKLIARKNNWVTLPLEAQATLGENSNIIQACIKRLPLFPPYDAAQMSL